MTVEMNFSPQELSAFDGSKPDMPIYVAIKGLVYDVTSKREAYGPGGSYHVFAGKDASKALGKSSLKPQDVSADYSELNAEELEPHVLMETLEEKLRSFEISIDREIAVNNHQFRAVRVLVPTGILASSLTPLLEQMEGVMWVEQDFRVKINSPPRPSGILQQSGGILQQNIISERDAPWALDRIDQRRLPLDNSYSFVNASGSGTQLFILDTGVDTNHKEFLYNDSSCASRARSGFSVSDNVGNGDGDHGDPNGHGTFTAGLAAGRTFGVAKSAEIISVQVLDRNGEGSVSDILSGLRWVSQEVSQRGTKDRTVINMSLGAPYSRSLNRLVNSMVRDGFLIVVAAGNDDRSACLESPSSSDAISVAASTREDKCAKFTNYGRCVDIFAPGEYVTSALPNDTIAVSQDDCPDLHESSGTLSGTSFSSPLVAGTLAMYLAYYGGPRAGATQEVLRQLYAQATRRPLSSCPGSSTPNLLLYAYPPGLGVGN